MNQMVNKNNKNNNKSAINSLVFGPWPQTTIAQIYDERRQRLSNIFPVPEVMA